MTNLEILKQATEKQAGNPLDWLRAQGQNLYNSASNAAGNFTNDAAKAALSKFYEDNQGLFRGAGIGAGIGGIGMGLSSLLGDSDPEETTWQKIKRIVGDSLMGAGLGGAVGGGIGHFTSGPPVKEPSYKAPQPGSYNFIGPVNPEQQAAAHKDWMAQDSTLPEGLGALAPYAGALEGARRGVNSVRSGVDLTNKTFDSKFNTYNKNNPAQALQRTVKEMVGGPDPVNKEMLLQKVVNKAQQYARQNHGAGVYRSNNMAHDALTSANFKPTLMQQASGAIRQNIFPGTQSAVGNAVSGALHRGGPFKLMSPANSATLRSLPKAVGLRAALGGLIGEGIRAGTSPRYSFGDSVLK